MRRATPLLAGAWIGIAAVGCATSQEADPFATALDMPASYQEQAPAPSAEEKDGALLDRAPTPHEREGLQRLMDRAEKLRGLRFVHEVKARIQNRESIKRYLKSKIDREAAERMRVRLVSLGLMAPGEDALDEKSLDAAAKQVLGYYEPEGEYLALSEEAASALAMAVDHEHSVNTRKVVIHELVHALQDQHFDLDAQLDRMRTTDETAAFFALVEGDATLAAIEYELSRWGIKPESLLDDPKLFARVMTGMPPTVGAAAIGPNILQHPVVFRYTAGALFAAQLSQRGGKAALDAAYMRKPRTTLEILQPERYLDRWRKAKVATLPLEPLERAGYRVVLDDVAGQLELGAYLTKGGVAADDLAMEWTGDRLVALQRGETYAAVWVVRLADPSLLPRALELAQEAGRATNDEKKPVPFEALSVGHSLLILRNVEPAAARAVAEAFQRRAD